MVETYNITGEPKSDALFIALEGCQKGDRVIYHVGPHCGGVHRFSALSASDRGIYLLQPLLQHGISGGAARRLGTGALHGKAGASRV